MSVANPKLITMSQRAKGLETRILDCGGRRLASVEGPNRSALDFYSLGKRVVIVQDHGTSLGVEVFFSSNKMQLKDIYTELDEMAKA